jgi:hypothetical protein
VPPQPQEPAPGSLDEGGDHIVGSAQASTAGSEIAPGGLALYRPLSLLTLGALPWSGRIEHDTLQRALQCRPTQTQARAAGLYAGPLSQLSAGALPENLGAEPALYVVLGKIEIDALRRLADKASGEALDALLQAAALPLAILGTASAVVAAARPALEAYRKASLLAAWQNALGMVPQADILFEQNTAALELLSTLRALLGES